MLMSRKFRGRGLPVVERFEPRICLSSSAARSMAIIPAAADSLNLATLPPVYGGAYTAVADVNGDGKLDLLTVGAFSNEIVVHLGNGNGTFQSGLAPLALGNSGGMAIADLNGDGKADLVATDSNGPTLSVFFGNGNGTFETPQTYAAVVSTCVAIANLTGDATPDIIVAGRDSSGTIDAFLGNGNGTFQAPSTIAAGGAITAVSVADLNGDGIPDLVVAAHVTGETTDVEVLLGNGNGTFQPPQIVASGSEFLSFAVGNFEGSIPDIATVDAMTDSVNIVLGNGDGTFAAGPTYAASPNPTDITVADMTGDGIDDLIIANSGQVDISQPTTSVLLGNGNGTFQPQLTFSGVYQAAQVIAADLTGDGEPDIIENSRGSYNNPVGILLNETPAASQNTFAVLSNGILTITGASNSDSISVTDDAGSVVAIENGQSSSPFSGVMEVSITGGGGNDTISMAGIPIPAAISGGGGDDSIIGGARGDSLKGGGGNDTIGGAGGNDTINGGSGMNSLRGGAGNDSITGTGSDNTIVGGGGGDTILGGAGNNTLAGGPGNDSVVSGSGATLLISGLGTDTLDGGNVTGDTLQYSSTGDHLINPAAGDSVVLV
jgi:Ca2+-binding RTX toxin-like protein